MANHAYLVLCHTNFEQLILLLRLLDDYRNDIYIHIDKKTTGFSQTEIKSSIEKSNVFFVKPIKVSWGGDSMIRAEMELLSEASKKEYQFYHLLSGLDLPLKSQDHIHTFFQKHPQVNYVSIDNYPNDSDNIYLDRVKYYYPFQNKIGRNSGIIAAAYYYLQNICLKIQKLTKINRTNNNLVFVKGGQWFDITHKAVIYVLSEFKKNKKNYRNTICGDEIFLQTILYNSPLKETICTDSLRLIDWNRGQPYTFTSEDYDMLMNSAENKLFARKFDVNIDEEIVRRIFTCLDKK